MKGLLVVFTVLVAASTSVAEIYTWKDSRGTTHYTNSLHEIPSRYVKKARILDVATGKKGPLVTSQPSPSTGSAAAPGGAAQGAMPQQAPPNPVATPAPVVPPAATAVPPTVSQPPNPAAQGVAPTPPGVTGTRLPPRQTLEQRRAQRRMSRPTGSEEE